MKVGVILLVLGGLVGCVTNQIPAQARESKNSREVADVQSARPSFPAKQKHRVLTDKQESLLREFALNEAPQLWSTVQTLRGEIDNREKAMMQLANELREFNRKPELDADYCELEAGCEHIACTLDNVYQKLEEAYIAYKKFQATPSKKEYADAMDRALEDGIHEAEATARRYRVMAFEK